MQRIEPTLLQSAKTLPVGEGWTYEPKPNGWRAVGCVGEKVTLLSRHGTDHTDEFPDVVNELAEAVSGQNVIVDGELVGLSPDGHEDFRELSKGRRARVAHFIFDVLAVDGELVIHRPLRVRRKILDVIFAQQEHIYRIPFDTDRDAVIADARKGG